MDIRRLKWKMKRHQKTCGERISPMLDNEKWGWAAKKNAWRITNKHTKDPSTQPGPVHAFLNPPLPKPEPINIIEPKYDWNGEPVKRNGAPPGVVWHHAAGFGTPQQIHAYHKSIGDRGIGYHFYVTRGGGIYRGRPEDTMGAHCLGHNDWIGVCAEGNYEAKDDMPQAQLTSLKALHKYLHNKYKIQDKKHRDMTGNSTACPGKFYPFEEIISSK